MCLRIVSDRGSKLHAGVPKTEGLSSLQVDDSSIRGFFSIASRPILSLRHAHRFDERSPVKDVNRVRVLSKGDVLSLGPQTLDKRPTRADGDVVIGCAVEQSYGFVCHVVVSAVLDATVGVESEVPRELISPRGVRSLEPPEAGVKSHMSTSRKSHHRNFAGLDSWVLRQHIQRPIDVDNHCQATKPVLIFNGGDDFAACEAIESESRHSECVKELGPVSYGSWNPSRAMDEHNSRQSCRS